MKTQPISSNYPCFCYHCGNKFPSYTKRVENSYRNCRKCGMAVNWNPAPFPEKVELLFADTPIKKNIKWQNNKMLFGILKKYFGTTKLALLNGSILLGMGALCLTLAPIAMAAYISIIAVAKATVILTIVTVILYSLVKKEDFFDDIFLPILLIPSATLFGMALALYLVAQILPIVGVVLIATAVAVFFRTVVCLLLAAKANGSLKPLASKATNVVMKVAQVTTHKLGYALTQVFSFFSFKKKQHVPHLNVS